MTVQQLALRLLGLSGVNSLTPDNSQGGLQQRGYVPSDLDAAASTINAAFQEIFSEGPSSLSEVRDGALLNAPTTITLSVTNNSKVVSITLGSASWMAGCTVRISGDQWDNQFSKDLTSLNRPYAGSTGSVSATVYADAVLMDSTVKAVLEPFRVPNRLPLHMCGSLEEFESFPFGLGLGWNNSRTIFSDSRMLLGGWGGFGQPKQIDVPKAVYVDTQYVPSATYTPTFLRLTPMPPNLMPLEFRKKLHAPIYTATDIGTGSTDPGTTIPMLVHESILLAIAEFRWMKQPSVVLSDKQAAAITAGYKTALQELRGMRPGVGVTQAQFE